MAAAPAPSRAFPFIFTDESGVVAKSPTEPFYGIGMLKISDAGRWADELNLRLDRFVSASQLRQKSEDERKKLAGLPVPLRTKVKRSSFEFHFSEITTWSRPFYEDLIDFFVAQEDGYFSAFVVDKRSKSVDPIAHCGSTWDALITYSIMLLRNRIGFGERAIVVSDNYQKPRKHPHYFERQVIYRLGRQAANCVMKESSASVLLQLVDVLLGCVMYHYKAPVLGRTDVEKLAVADRLAAAYGVKTFAVGSPGLTIKKPNFFDIWPFQPRPKQTSGLGTWLAGP